MNKVIRATTKPSSKKASGFTLVEMAIVLLVLGVLMRAAVQPMGARLEASQRSGSRAQLEQIKAAMIGYLILYGRLPCPGGEAVSDDVPCPVMEGGINAPLLGLAGEIDEAGLLLDSWGTPLHYRIANTEAGHDPLSICRIAGTRACARSDVRADQLELVVLSFGRDPSAVGAQAGNLDGDGLFVQPPDSKADGHEFDDQLVWMSQTEMAYWLLRSGR